MRDLSRTPHRGSMIGQDGGVMSSLLNYLLPLAIVLPLGGFVAGSLVSAAQDDPGPRTPIVLREGS